MAPNTGIVEKMLGVWMCEEIESGISPNSQKPYDKIVSSYNITPDGIGFFESFYYYYGTLLVEIECDRVSSGKFTYEWVKDTEITCTDFESGEQWKVTYIRGVFTDWEDPDDPVTYTKVMFDKSL